ncbi:LOW QUALITY PROTEIN: uncharacterized protein LOC114956697 [Acropora millepora]|uniref:LOW QUALITY PROTEIN: uncharacterized protein LOC114956697 n=1 Tax=Acropora millepora TaxID=45264 RepID=UPI001CF0E24F|nr:LOW QUALITY PROTEIN: uncharacterized protein LOC114956697 [Acropora millepora]
MSFMSVGPVFWALWFVLSTCIAFTSSKTLCSRIFFQNINEETMPYKMIEGVYVKENNTYNNFPVYKEENGNMLFYLYMGKEGSNFLSFGRYLQWYFGAAAILKAMYPSLWLSYGTLDRKDVFKGLIDRWLYFDRKDGKNYYVTRSSTSTQIKAVCVDEDFRECHSDRLYLNVTFNDGKGNIIHNREQDYFRRKQGVFRNLRPVFTHSRTKMYLQYVEGYWMVTGAYFPSSSLDKTAYMKVKDFALRPEYITKTWLVHFNGVWRQMPQLSVLCRGVTSMSNTCASRPCHSNATCRLQCSEYKRCPVQTRLANTVHNSDYAGRRPGDLSVSFCKFSNPWLRFSICMDGSISPFWSGQGKACMAVLPDSRTPKPSRLSLDNNPYIFPLVLTGAVLLQCALPFLLHCCARCVAAHKEVKDEQDELRREQEAGIELGRRLQQVAVAGSQEELDRGIEEYQEAVQNFKDESDEKELSRNRGFFRNASLWRLISMQMNLSFYLWLVYFVGCEVSQCTRYGRIFDAFRYFAIVIMSISPVIVFVESIFSHELAYLKNIMQDITAWGYIQKMHEVPPEIVMIVECYHYETRTRVVYYTDVNGNLQSRIETYTEKVTTFVDQDEFSFGSWVDVSKREMPPIGYASLTRVKIDPCILFGDQETADDYTSQVSEMIERNKYRDAFTEYSAKRQIPGLKKRFSTYVDLNVRPWWIRTLYFWIATLLMMSWPYRWFFRAKTSKTYYILKKKMYNSTTPPSEVDITDPIAVLSSNASSLMPAANCAAASDQRSDAITPYPSAPPLQHAVTASVGEPHAVEIGQPPCTSATSTTHLPNPSESAIPSQSSTEPPVPPSFAGGLMSESPPPSYEETVGRPPAEPLRTR